MLDFSNSTVLVTGGHGFLGRHLVAQLESLNCRQIHAPRSSECDLRCSQSTRALLERLQPDLIFHLAAVVGGIGANQRHPGRFFYDNAIMGIQLLELARQGGVGKVVVIGTVCAYPKFTPVPFKEDDLWSGYPEETNAPYGLAKKMLLVQSQAYRQEYGFNSIYLLPTNLYGPGDNFHPETSHVIPAMIRKFAEAKDQGVEVVTLWGDGSPTREFLYVKDAAAGIALAALGYEGAEPVNLGSGVETDMKTLASIIARVVGYSGQIAWDTSRPNGQPRRCLDVSRASSFGFKPSYDLERGLSETVAAYYESVKSIREVTFQL